MRLRNPPPTTTPFFVHEIATRQTRELGRLSPNTDGERRIESLQFDGQYLAWRLGNEMTALDVTTGKERRYSGINRLRDVVGIDAGRVLYESIDNSSCEGSAAVGVRVWNVTTGEDLHAASKGCRAPRPAIRGDVVAWATYAEKGPTSLKLHFLKGGATRTLLTDDIAKENLALTDRYVVYRGTEPFQSSKLVAVPVQPDGL